MNEISDAANTPIGAEPPAIWGMRAESMVLKARRRVIALLGKKSPMSGGKLRNSLTKEHRAVFDIACRQLEDGDAIYVEEIVYQGQAGTRVHLLEGHSDDG